MYLSFYLPFMYSIKTRFPTIPRFVSWLIIYFFPVLFSFCFFFDGNVFFPLIYRSFISIALVYTLYEIGYIYNDTETVKKELKPTLRLDKKLVEYYEIHKILIYSCRFVVAIFLSCIIYMFYHSILFLAFAWSLIPLYFLYNTFRSRINIPLHFLLVTVRFCSIILIFSDKFPFIPFLMMAFIFPVINTLERCSEKRFNLPYFEGLFLTNRKDGRYKYYSILLCVSLALLANDFNQVNLVFVFFSLYFFLYRLVVSGINIK